jgi:hypothetical protein
MALSAVSCIQRGVTNLRANWELVIVSWLQGLLTSSLVIVGFVPPLAVLGLTNLDAWLRSGGDWQETLAQAGQLVNRGVDTWILLGAALVVSFAIWLMAFMVYCFFQGGILGVLMTGDRQAPEEIRHEKQWFRTFSGRDLRGWGGRYLWRYFWLLNLMAAFALLWLLLVGVAFGLTVLGAEQWGPAAAFGIGCGSSIPLVFGMVMIAMWASLAQADLAFEDSEVGTATRRSLSLLGRRLGAVSLIFLLAVVLGVLLGIGISSLSIASTLLLPDSGPGHWLGATVQLGLNVVELIVGSAVAIGFSASLVSLVRSEISRELAA